MTGPSFSANYSTNYYSCLLWSSGGIITEQLEQTLEPVGWSIFDHFVISVVFLKLTDREQQLTHTYCSDDSLLQTGQDYFCYVHVLKQSIWKTCPQLLKTLHPSFKHITQHVRWSILSVWNYCHSGYFSSSFIFY